MRNFIVVFLSLSLVWTCSNPPGKIHIETEEAIADFAERKIQAACAKSHALSSRDYFIHIGIDPALADEGYSLKIHGDTINIAGGDGVGALYGGYELAEQIKLYGIDKITEKTESPRFPFRAIKFNLPWSAYRDHAVVHQHQEIVKDLDYWEQFMDMMIENRFNVLSLWNLHPFTYMFRPRNYPEACGFSDEELAEWQTFWTALFKMAKDRGIETYMVWWNIFVSPEFAEYHQVSDYSKELRFYGNGEHSELIDQYNKECVTQLINEYPDLTGIGISLGERMYHIEADAREQWILDVTVEGMKAADRKVKFIHRAPFTKHAEVTRKGIESIDHVIPPVWVEFKFNASHGHSSTNLMVTHGADINTAYWDPEPENYKMVWMMRNEDFVCLRWGQSDFIRTHIELNGKSYAGGYFVGSETLIPAKDYIQKYPDERINWSYEYERHWMFYKQWGKLLYNPSTSDQLFMDELANRYGRKHAETLFEAMNLAGKVNLRISSFHRGGNDPSLTVEHCLSRNALSHTGALKKENQLPFMHINYFIKHSVLDYTQYCNIRDYVAKELNEEKLNKGVMSPLQLADTLENDAIETLSLLKSIKSKPGPVDYEIADIKAWAYLGQYYAEKIRGGTALELYRKTGEKDYQEIAIAHLSIALEHWKSLAQVTDEVMQPIQNAKFTHLSEAIKYTWTSLIEYVAHDIEIAEKNIQ